VVDSDTVCPTSTDEEDTTGEDIVGSAETVNVTAELVRATPFESVTVTVAA
jgi:hypothetical protein